jgi:predicted RNase H-like nuclease (RuvC/YqgF family)
VSKLRDQFQQLQRLRAQTLQLREQKERQAVAAGQAQNAARVAAIQAAATEHDEDEDEDAEDEDEEESNLPTNVAEARAELEALQRRLHDLQRLRDLTVQSAEHMQRVKAAVERGTWALASTPSIALLAFASRRRAFNLLQKARPSECGKC